MYTLEQRTRAVELYIKHGLKATTTIRELGYPSRVQLCFVNLSFHKTASVRFTRGVVPEIRTKR